jgi:HAD superfamily hydrolase (TIGR01509 family)
VTPSAKAVLFDVDGTLTDTNYLHSIAWWRAFIASGEFVPTAWIHRRIGMGSSLLMQDLIGEARDDVKKRWRVEFDELKGEIRALPGARDLLQSVAARGADVVLATSAEEADVEALLHAIDAGDAISVVTSAGDVDEAKPSPDVFTVALEKTHHRAEDAIVVGDTVWDVEAARRAGLDCVCVLTGGIGRDELEQAGAVAVYRDPRELLEQLDSSPLAPYVGATPR